MLKQAISYKCPYVIAIVVPYQKYTVVMITIPLFATYANCLQLYYSPRAKILAFKVELWFSLYVTVLQCALPTVLLFCSVTYLEGTVTKMVEKDGAVIGVEYKDKNSQESKASRSLIQSQK